MKNRLVPIDVFAGVHHLLAAGATASIVFGGMYPTPETVLAKAPLAKWWLVQMNFPFGAKKAYFQGPMLVSGRVYHH